MLHVSDNATRIFETGFNTLAEIKDQKTIKTFQDATWLGLI